MSRWENAPTLREVVRMTYAMIDAYCASYQRPPEAVTLDIAGEAFVAPSRTRLRLSAGEASVALGCPAARSMTSSAVIPGTATR